jgi:energy-coupling factor transporter ATP-binding protein EcfA2
MRPGGTLAASEITVHRGAEAILERVTLVIQPGSRIGVVGANGRGKTTLLRALAGLEPLDGGSGGAPAGAPRAGARREALAALGSAVRARSGAAGRRPRRRVGQSRGRARAISARAVGPMPLLGRAAVNRRFERLRQVDATRRRARQAAARERHAAGRPERRLRRDRTATTALRRVSTDDRAVLLRDRDVSGRGPHAARQVRPVRRPRGPRSRDALAGGANSSGAGRPGSAGGKLTRPRRADEPPRPARDRGARARPRGYEGTLMLITHDRRFLARVGVTRQLDLER